ncbi:hypothetical protein [Niabella drilacis]|uniref:Uncharacterized protein n=1 Tax=Niabella drilacis (strain DSM 25811 / CCM 8410 / CCUG 62505 / LMG 26954 / E90) TaxID=1285928 RepID=A0A1G6Q1N5_NIADE|nr:hypothetical protein [Niabella drilacis]SDC85824.1 hypothetical protein SAMN04487894_104231 [Niabella drilacis]
MDTKPGKSSSGILRNIKRLIFEDEGTSHEEFREPAPVPPVLPAQKPEPVSVPVYTKPVDTGAVPGGDLKEMKGRVLELLEKLNEEGIDFFEVWNAAADMGTIDAVSIKAAFTSLRYVDKSLTRDRLLSSARKYAAKIQEVIDQDVAQKQGLKQTVQSNLVNEKQQFEKEMNELETKIRDLQNQLSSKQQSYKELDSKYEDQLKDIDQKISVGRVAVNEVVSDIQKAIAIIEQNIN